MFSSITSSESYSVTSPTNAESSRLPLFRTAYMLDSYMGGTRIFEVGGKAEGIGGQTKIVVK